MSSRLGSENFIPPWPMAMPSSTAMVLNSNGRHPAPFVIRSDRAAVEFVPIHSCSTPVSVLARRRQKATAPRLRGGAILASQPGSISTKNNEGEVLPSGRLRIRASRSSPPNVAASLVEVKMVDDPGVDDTGISQVASKTMKRSMTIHDTSRALVIRMTTTIRPDG